MNNFKHIFKLFAFGAISVLILSCSDDDTFIEMGNNGYEQGLIIEPPLPSMEGDFTATRADEPGDPELNENFHHGDEDHYLYFERCYADIAKAIATCAKSRVDFEDGYATQNILLAMYESAENGKLVGF